MRGNALLPIYCSSANALDYHIRQTCAALKEGRPPMAQNRHADAVAACLLLGDERTWLGRGSGVLSSSPSLRGLLPSLGETRACPRRARRGRSSLVILVLSWKIYTVRQKDYRWGCSVGDVVAHLWLAAAELH